MISTLSNTVKALFLIIGTSLAFADCSDFDSPEACYDAGCEWVITITPDGDQVIEMCVDPGWDGWEDDCDPDLFCAEVLTCVDGLLYPTSCGPDNCDEDIGLCEDSGGDGPPECILDCPGISDIGPDISIDELCEFLVTIAGSECMEDCDEQTIAEFEFMASICEECLAEGNCEDFFGDDGTDCSDIENEDVCWSSDGCEWVESDSPSGAGSCVEEGDDGDDGDGPPECILDCPGVEDLGPNAGSLEICEVIVSIISSDCMDDCDPQTMLELEYLAGACEECLPTGDCDGIFDGSEGCDELTQDECEISGDCEWVPGDNTSGAGSCVDADDGEDGLPECMLDCPGLWLLPPDADSYEICEFFVSTNGTGCVEDCDPQTLAELEYITGICEECLATDSCDGMFEDEILGDVNSDGDVNVLDVIQTVNIILEAGYNGSADINSDGSIDITDVVLIINIILGNDIARESGLADASYELGGDYLRIVADADIAGVQLTVSGSYDIDRTKFESGWIVEEHDGVIVIANIDGTNRSHDIVIEFSGNLSPESIDVVGWDAVSVSAGPVFELPSEISLGKAYPNPFNPSTEIGFLIAHSSEITLSVLNISGQVVSVLASGTYESGEHSVQWDASDLSSGIYLIQLISGSYMETQKVTLVK